MMLRLRRAWPIAFLLLCACHYDAVAPPGQKGALTGAWVGEVMYEDRIVLVEMLLQHDGVRASGVFRAAQTLDDQSEYERPASDADECVDVEIEDESTITFDKHLGYGIDASLKVQVSYQQASDTFVGQWAINTTLVGANGELVLRRLSWLPMRLRADGMTTTLLDCLPPSHVPQCADGIDNDGDGKIDELDDGCCTFVGYVCSLVGNTEQTAPRTCADGLDNDADGFIDDADVECESGPGENGAVWFSYGGNGSEPAETPQCSNGVDDDEDGHVDLDDPSCHGQPGRTYEVAISSCDDGLDNDGDGLVDDESPYCSRSFSGSEAPDAGGYGSCANRRDDDGDGLIDALDPQCFWIGYGNEIPYPFAVEPPTSCDDGLDNDGDGLVDWDDPQCWTRRYHSILPVSFESTPPCVDGVDNDGDGKVDLDDMQCTSFASPTEHTECDNGVDDDRDGVIDLEDPGCADDPSRREIRTACDDMDDNDNDGLVDMADPDCASPYDVLEIPACADTFDNDGDFFADRGDPDCTDPSDTDESQ